MGFSRGEILSTTLVYIVDVAEFIITSHITPPNCQFVTGLRK